MNLFPWSLTLKIIACSFHSVAIACTVFRLTYRWYRARFWWEDGFAAFALAVDVVCLVATWLEVPETAQGVMPPIDTVTNWMAAIGFACVLWACRASILLSIVRVANPSQQFRRIAIAIGCSFLIMWAALIGQRIHVCLESNCLIAASVGLSQLITDVISDASLVVLPIYLLRKTKINYRRRVMVYSAFSASLLITVISIFQSTLLFSVHSNGIIVIGHVKTAVALIVCNLLVIVAVLYRACRRGVDLDAREEAVSFTSVNLDAFLPESTFDKYSATTVERRSGSEMSTTTTTTSTSHSGTIEDGVVDEGGGELRSVDVVRCVSESDHGGRTVSESAA